MRHRIPRRSRAEIARTIRFALARRQQRQQEAAQAKSCLAGDMSQGLDDNAYRVRKD
ncbi:hypothetical protein [Leclercia sp.]|uniref:hypothetical protein n=1 Tax=Leclercia sp. TaxID=1898428 RepID=UPI0028A74C55|nr:hypothetical protein [Leclercia sp.]